MEPVAQMNQMDNDTTEDLLRNHTIFAQQMEERYNDIEKRLAAEERVIAQLKEDNQQQHITIEMFRKSTAQIDSEIAEIQKKYMELTAKRKKRERSLRNEVESVESSDSDDVILVSDSRETGETSQAKVTTDRGEPDRNELIGVCQTKDGATFNPKRHNRQKPQKQQKQLKPQKQQKQEKQFDQTEHSYAQHSAVRQQTQQVKTMPNIPKNLNESSGMLVSSVNLDQSNESSHQTDRRKSTRRKNQAQILLERVEVVSRPKRKAAPVNLKEPSIRIKNARSKK